MTLNLKKYLDKAKDSLKRFSHIFRADPYNNWILLVLIFVILNTFLISGKILEFYNISSDEALLSESSQQTNVGTINRSALAKTLLMFETRRENYEDLKRNRPVFADPSI